MLRRAISDLLEVISEASLLALGITAVTTVFIKCIFLGYTGELIALAIIFLPISLIGSFACVLAKNVKLEMHKRKRYV